MGHSMKTNGSMMQRSSTEYGVHTKQLTASEEIPQYSTTYTASMPCALRIGWGIG
jgi:hypothetical protein